MPLQSHNGEIPGEKLFVAYIGPSMNPTLREPETMEILPYDGRPVRVGDVVLFLPPNADQSVVHRVVRATPAGISTRGDNNTHEDALLLQIENIQGQVVAAWRGQNRRKIAGGWQGRLISRWFRWRGVLDRGVSPLLHPPYQALFRRGWIARWMPAPLRPRVIVFHVRGRDQFQLLLGRRIIGRYDDFRRRWQIQRPFHLLVDGRTLPGQQDRGPSKRKASTERRRTSNPAWTQDVLHHLVLADGTRWEIAAGDAGATSMVTQLGRAMQLSTVPGASDPAHPDPPCRLLVQMDAHSPGADGYVPLAVGKDGIVVCGLSPCEQWGGPNVNLVRLSLVIAREAQTHGGVLLHGALAELNGNGVILPAPGGTGKTTASNRFPAPWRSLSDDATLVVRDAQGNYWAHPWPTWSRFLEGGPGGTWDVQHAVPLKGIFFLAQAIEDRVERVGPGQAASLLAEFSGQISMFMAPGLWGKEISTLHLERFDNLCALARTIPAHRLHISLAGAFWQEIEQALEVEEGCGNAVNKNESRSPLQSTG